MRHERDCEKVSKAHGWVFGCLGVKPANTLLVGGIVGEEFLVEVEAEVVVGCGERGVWRVGEGDE